MAKVLCPCCGGVAGGDPGTLELARRVGVIVDGNPDPNALVPVTVEITLHDGRNVSEGTEVMYEHPARPVTHTAQRDKFRRNCETAARPNAPEAAVRVIAALARLESLPDVAALVDDIVPVPAAHSPTRLSGWSCEPRGT